MQENARTFYLIAHGCNSLSTIHKAFKQKVNGIECDCWLTDEKQWIISHDGFHTTELLAWLNCIKEGEKKYGQQLALIVFDIKKDENFQALREIINANLPVDLPRLYSVASLDMAHIFIEISPDLRPYEAIAVDEEDNPQEVATFFTKIGAKQCWYGNGISLMPFDGQYHDSMQQAATIRDSTQCFSKVYTWSIHHKEAMHKYIVEDKVDAMLVGLNGILTRPVSKALKIIKSNNLILADRNTSIF